MNAFRSTSSWVPQLLSRSAVQPRAFALLHSSAFALSDGPQASTSTGGTSPVAASSSALDSIQASLESEAAALPSSLTSPPSSSSSDYPPSHFRRERSIRVPGASAPAKASTHEDAFYKAYPVDYPIPATPTSARSVPVKNNDLAMAYRRLNRILMENNVRRELRQQERFESGSDRRVRLNSERHRKRFKVAVGKAVSLAMRMKDL